MEAIPLALACAKRFNELHPVGVGLHGVPNRRSRASEQLLSEHGRYRRFRNQTWEKEARSGMNSIYFDVLYSSCAVSVLYLE